MENNEVALLDDISSYEEGKFLDAFERQLINGDGQAAERHLGAGRPIVYWKPEYPNDVVREWPDGLLELINYDLDGEIVNVRPL